MAMTPFGAWLPDQADYQNAGVTVASNVLARTAKANGETSYGPLAALAELGTAMTNRVQGGASFRDNDGNVYTFAADINDLFLYNAGTAVFDEVTKSSAAMTVAADDHINFAKYGERVIAVNGHADHPQSYVLGTSSKFADLGGSGPRARHIAVVGDFIMVGNTWDSTDESVVNRVWWAAIDDPTDWPTIASADAAAKQSDRQDLATGEAVQGILGAVGAVDGAIFSEKAVRRIQYDGPPHVFSFPLVENARGTPAPNSIVNVGTHAFYLGEDGFYAFTGATSVPLGDGKVDKHFFADLDQTYFHRIYGVADAINKIVFWAYPGSNSTNGVPDSIIMYNWAIDRWSKASVDCEMLFQALSASYTMETLDTLSASLDALGFSLDSRVLTNGRLLLSGFSTNNKLAHFTGTTLEATIETAETGGPGMTLVNGYRPVVDGGTVTVGLKTRDLPTATEVLIGPNAVDADGMAHFNKTARYHRAQIVVAAAGSWGHAAGGEYDATPEGIV